MFDHHTLNSIFQALAICLILTGIHGYLGIHVLERKVIFVDLAMAQIAALGATYAYALGYRAQDHPVTVYIFSLAFTLTGAAVFSLTRMRSERVPQEAFIGIIYATASAVAILILAKSTSAGEQLKSILVGDILRARWWPHIATTAAIYSAIGLFHYAFRHRFFRISLSPEKAYESGLRVRFWDFLFYATFGVVITSSVSIAGVLLVFSFLVVPACIGTMFADTPGRRILIAWAAGSAVSFLGVGFTFYEGNFPAGPVVVAAFAAVLALSGLARYVRHAPRPSAALGRVAAGTLLVAALAAGSWTLRNREHDEAAHETAHVDRAEFDRLVDELRSADETRQLHAIEHLQNEPDPRAVPELVRLVERGPAPRILEHLASTLRAIGDPKAVPALRTQAARPDLDAALRFELAQAIVDLKDPAGLGFLLDILGDDAAPRLQRVKSLKLFAELTGRTFGYEVGGAPDRLDRIRDWWKEHGDHIKWREATRRFE